MWPEDYGLTRFYNGDYFFEFRFIGHRSIYTIGATLTVTGLTDIGSVDLTSVSFVTGKIFNLVFSGTTSECWGVLVQHSLDNTNWINGAWGSCNSPKQSIVEEENGIWFFRIVQRDNFGVITYSNVLSYTY